MKTAFELHHESTGSVWFVIDRYLNDLCSGYIKNVVLFILCALDKEAGDRLSRLVEEACMLLADYSGRLAAELDDRRQLTRTLTAFLQSQKDGLVQNEQKLEVRKSIFFYTICLSVFVLSTSPLCHYEFLVCLCMFTFNNIYLSCNSVFCVLPQRSCFVLEPNLTSKWGFHIFQFTKHLLTTTEVLSTTQNVESLNILTPVYQVAMFYLCWP